MCGAKGMLCCWGTFQAWHVGVKRSGEASCGPPQPQRQTVEGYDWDRGWHHRTYRWVPGPVVCTLSARMSGAEFSVGLAVVSINTAQHESLRATCTTLAVGQCQWGTINPPDAPGLVVAVSRWGLSVPRLFLCVGALHPICRHYTSSVRVHRHVTGVVPLIGCSAPVLVAVVAAVGVVGVFWA